MNQNHPPRISAMIDKMNLINGDLSSVTMSISLDGAIGSLPETIAIKENLGKEHATKLLKALNDAFSKNDLTKVTALYSYVQLFPEQLQTEIRSETLIEFKEFISKKNNETELANMFLHPGFTSLVNTFQNEELIDRQFKIFEKQYLSELSSTGKRIAISQKNLSLNTIQKEKVVTYIKKFKQNYTLEENLNKKNIFLAIFIIVAIVRIFIYLSSRSR
jgi:hypothetical protein